MIRKEEWVMIKHLWKQGLNKSEISRRIGINRKTVSKMLKLEVAPRYKRKRKERKVLGLYEEYIEERLSCYNLSSQKLYEEMQKIGYKGGYGTVNNYVKKMKNQLKRKAVLRFETLPGEQAQVDWGYFGQFYDQERKEWLKLYCFLMVLGYSRMRYIKFFDAAKLKQFLIGHNNAFKYFGGYTRELLYDNLKSVVIKRALRAADSEFNKEFMDFAGYYGFNPILARPYKPNTKGKVENSVHYVRSNFFAGEEFKSLEDINRKAKEWLHKVNSKVHNTTHEIPFDRLKKENLIPLASRMYDTQETEYRKIMFDCYFSYGANLYSVPFLYAGKEIAIKAYNDYMDIFYRGKIVAQHKIEKRLKGIYITNPEHFKGLKRLRYGGMTLKKRMTPNDPFAYLTHTVEVRDLSKYEEGQL